MGEDRPKITSSRISSVDPERREQRRRLVDDLRHHGGTVEPHVDHRGHRPADREDLRQPTLLEGERTTREQHLEQLSTGLAGGRRRHADDRHVGVVGCVDHHAEPGRHVGVHTLDIEPPPALQRQQRCTIDLVVGEQGEAAALGGAAAVDELHRAGVAQGSRLVDVGVVEEPELELHPQQPPGRRIDARFVDVASGHELGEQRRPGLTAELVDAGVDRLHDPARGRRGARRPSTMPASA